ncbi:MAG TPA: glycoside hydrolase family 3 C-terminal domain-containing protein [Phycisphaerae bacterium]|nr:glycoside hydrolase family 3 C-terminal domain-containing protein [Phycisphaerae bacterium]
MRKVRVGILLALAATLAACAGGPGSGGNHVEWARQWAGCCGKRMVVSGDAHYFEMKDGKTVTSEPIPEGFAAEIWGQGLVASVYLRPGRYTVEVAGSENVFRQAEEREFDVLVDGQPIQTNVDLYKITGGTGRVFTVKGTVDHPGGEMQIVLRATRNNAKFSGIRITDAAGEKVAWALAIDLMGIEKELADHAPVIHGPVIWKDYAKPTDARVSDLLRRMTLREKVAQMQNSAPEIKRLGIPAYDYWNECLHGVARSGYATVFPQAIGMAASWDTDYMHTIADAISTEARAKYNDAIAHNNRDRYYGLTFWTPNINIFRDPRWGRGQETYGEDPFLTGKMAVSFITGLQGDDPKYFKVVATAKHYAVHSGPEVLRHIFDATPPQNDFYEEYLPQFEMAVREGHVDSIMGAYNDVYGSPACASELLLTDLLRNTWGFNGYVVSDCGAITDIWWNHHDVQTRAEAAAKAVKAGCDLECGSDYSALASAVDMGLITEKQVDTALGRILTARFKLGMFDPPAQVKYSSISITENDSPAHNAIALEMAHKSMVLLKNDHNVLPLRKDLKKIAVVGPNADSLLPLLGNYFGVPSRPVMVLDGIRNAVPGTEVVYVRGCDIGTRFDGPELVPDVCLRSGSATGLHGEYFDNPNFAGVPIAIRQDHAIDFNGWIDRTTGGIFTPPNGAIDFSARWSGEFVAPADGTYEIKADGASNYRLFLNNKMVQDNMTGGGGLVEPGVTPTVTLKAGESVPLVLETVGYGGVLNLELTWDKRNVDVTPQVLDQIKGADAIIFVGGLDGRIEQEEGAMRAPIDGLLNGDRVSIELPAVQTQTMRALASTGIPLVYVNMTGSAVAVPWEKENVPAILQAWYPGQMAGKAIADVLFGDYNPGGKLPLTFYSATTDLPSFLDYTMAAGNGRTYRYYKGTPLFAFGHGLSYTTFDYSNPQLTTSDVAENESLWVTLDITNTGPRDGEEVVQIYARPDVPTPGHPMRKLVAFQRVAVPAGKKVTIDIPVRAWDMRNWDDAAKKYRVPPGTYHLDIGSSSDDIRKQIDIHVK